MSYRYHKPHKYSYLKTGVLEYLLQLYKVQDAAERVVISVGLNFSAPAISQVQEHLFKFFYVILTPL